MRMTVLGCGNAFSAGGRYQSCYLLDTAGGRAMLDCGATTSLAMNRERILLDTIDAILITHLHGDHIGGLPFLLIDAIFVSNRRKPLPIFGPPGVQARIETLMEAFYPGILAIARPFDMPYIELMPQQTAGILGFELLPFEVRHESGAPALGFRIEESGRIFSFSGDTGWCENLIPLGRDAHLFLVECSTWDQEMPMHLDYATLARHFPRIGAHRYMLTHMNLDMLTRADDVDRRLCLLAEDGLVIDV